MARPANYFEKLLGIPVLYDRIKPEHYGKTGIPYHFHCTRPTQNTLEALFEDLFKKSEAHFGKPTLILSAGAYVEKPGEHGLGQAFDLDAIHWERARLVAKEQRQKTALYLAVQAICNKYCGVVLGYDYNADHEDHLHVDIGREPKFRQARSITTFIQSALNTLYGHNIGVDGEWGNTTERALNQTLRDLGIANVTTLKNWKLFLDRVCQDGLTRAANEIAADNLVARSDMSRAAPVLVTLDTAAVTPAPGMPYVATLNESATRPNTGRIDMNYKPFSNWAVYPKTVKDEMNKDETKWYVDFGAHSGFYMGKVHALKDTPYVGLARPATKTTPDIPYEFEAYRPLFGLWAPFIYPTGRCESEAKFMVINAYDSAAMTFGFFQMAGHTGKHLSELIKDLIEALPNEAQIFYPELKLGKQIGIGNPRQLYAVNGSDVLDLDAEARPSDGLPYSKWFRGRFMEFFNPHRGKLETEEVVSAARWVAWLQTSVEAGRVCVTNAVAGAKRTVQLVHKNVLDRGHAKYPNGLHGVSMSLVAAAMDVKHHGRYNRDLNQDTDQSIFLALIANDPWVEFTKIDIDWREKRSIRSVAEIKAMNAVFKNKTYDANKQDFV